MYMEDVFNVKKTDDGKFVVQVFPPAKKKETSGKGEMPMPATVSEPKTLVANSVEELTALVEEHLSKSDTDDKKFKKGFKKA